MNRLSNIKLPYGLLYEVHKIVGTFELLNTFKIREVALFYMISDHAKGVKENLFTVVKYEIFLLCCVTFIY